jgi:3-oxoacid CoA-transferase A subunit
MQNKLFASFADAVKDIPDGSVIMFGGFGPGTPHNLTHALYHHTTARDLTLILNSAGTGSRPDIITPANFVEEGRARKAIMAFTASTHPSRRSKMEDLFESGAVEAELVPQGSLAERIRAAGAGIPAFYTPAGVGTQTAEGKEHRDFNGRTHVMEHALPADYAFVRAKKCDEFGNLVFQGSERNFNPIMAMAARVTIAEVEEIVPAGSIDPNQVHTPGIYVNRIVKIPADGIFFVPRVAPGTT